MIGKNKKKKGVVWGTLEFGIHHENSLVKWPKLIVVLEQEPQHPTCSSATATLSFLL